MLVQCKNYNSPISFGDICAFEGVLSRFPNDVTLGVYVTSRKHDYSSFAIDRANSSTHNILLTNIYDLHYHPYNYRLKNDESELWQIRKDLELIKEMLIQRNEMEKILIIIVLLTLIIILILKIHFYLKIRNLNIMFF